MDQDRLKARKKVQLIKNLPTLPGMIEKISRMVESKQHSAEDISRLISQDQVLSAKVLKLANAAFYGFSRRISSITQALVMLGFNVIKGLILTSSVFDLLQSRANDLWVHSLAAATAAGVLANRLDLAEAEEVNLAGLLHDLGKVVMAVNMSQDLEEVQDLTARGEFQLEAESRVLGFTHPEAGAWLAESWKLPLSLTEPIMYHHQPARAKEAALTTAVVHLADILVKARGLGFGRDVWVPPLEPGALELLGLKIDDLDEIVPQVHLALSRAVDLEGA